MKINFYKGAEFCAKCGRDITNIIEIITDNGIRYVVGTECFNKITNLNETGVKLIKKYQAEIMDCQEKIKMYESNNIELLTKNIYKSNIESDLNKLAGSMNYKNWEELKNDSIWKLEGRIEQKTKELNKKMIGVKIRG